MMTSWNIPSMSTRFETKKKILYQIVHTSPRGALKGHLFFWEAAMSSPPKRRGEDISLRVFFTWDTEKKKDVLRENIQELRHLIGKKNNENFELGPLQTLQKVDN